MRVYVINLARSAERRHHMRAELTRAALDWELVEAVDGRTVNLDDPALIDPVLRKAAWMGAKPAGCALSHLAVYRRIATEGPDHVLVLEDDVDLAPGLGGVLDALPALMADAEVALLCYHNPDRSRIKLNSHSAQALPGGYGLYLPADLGQLRATAGYVITRQAAQRFVRMSPPVRLRVEDWAGFCEQKFLDRVRCVYPLPVGRNPRFASTISAAGENGLRARALRFSGVHGVRAVERLAAWRRRRIWRSQERAVAVPETDAHGD